jgi:hypothetical protein
VAELKAQVAALQPAPISGYNTIKNDERRTVEILHRNQLEAMDVDRRLQYDKLVHDFLVSWSTCISLCHHLALNITFDSNLILKFSEHIIQVLTNYVLQIYRHLELRGECKRKGLMVL